MRFSVETRWVDAAIKVILVLLVIALAYLVYNVVSFQLQQSRSGPASQAIDNLIAAVEESPQDIGLRLTLAEAFAADGRLRESIDQFNAALEIEPDSPNALSGLALISMHQGEWETAEQYWRRAITELSGGQYSLLDQRLERALYQLGVTLIERGEYEEAVQYLTEALRIRRGSADTHYMLAYAYRELGSDVNHRKYLEQALMFDPRMPEANYDLGLVMLAEGDVAGAAERFRESAKYAPPGRREPQEQLDKLKREADAQERADNARELAATDVTAAIAEARIARALAPDDVDTAKLVAELFEKAGDTESATGAWRYVLEIAPNDEAAAAAMARLTEE